MTQELFSHRVKAEAAKNITGRKRCAACLGGMVLFSNELSDGGICFKTENKTVRDLFIKFSEHIIGSETVYMTKKKREGKPSLYTLRIKGSENVGRILRETGILSVLPRTLCGYSEAADKQFSAFSAGVFLACGSVVEPSKGYHLEFVTPFEGLCKEFSEALYSRLELDGRIIKRRSSYVLYFKESENIEDILTLIGAQKSSIELMNVKIYKDIRNNINRAVNCDTANLGKQSRSAKRQLEAVDTIRSRGGMDRLSDELRAAAELREKHPEMSLSELCAAADPPVSRSGLNHRLNRLIEIAEDIKNG